MKWIFKAKVQKLVSALPVAEQLNYFMQKKVARNLPVPKTEFFTKVRSAVRHFDMYKKYSINGSIEEDTFFEFGAGWDLIIPLIYFAMGINKQVLIDITPHIKFDLINDTLIRLTKYKTEIEKKNERAFRIISPAPVITRKNDLERIFGIQYIAPLDASNTGFPAGSIDFISNTATFEHIPEAAILPILKESYRILKPGGVMSCLIDLNDHYSYVDKSISCYNFLKFNDQVFDKYNSSIHYQNRLRYSDYVNKIKQAGFSIIEEKIQYPTEEDTRILKSLEIDSKFRDYNLHDLGVRTLHEILRK